MKIDELIRRQETSISFEFFPPKNTEGEEQLFEAIAKLRAFEPTFVSVTYGAGGSTKDNTRHVVQRIIQETPLTVMPHLTCVNQSEPELKEILTNYREIGIENILALRGDPPRGIQSGIKGDLCYGEDLVRLAASLDAFSIGVAVYPEGHLESPNQAMDMVYTKQKVDAGADFAITQMFFDNHYFYDFAERAEKIGIRIPVIAGIMPITDIERIMKFSQMCGATLPVPLLEAMEAATSPDEVRKIGIDFAIRQSEDLLRNGFRYIHFYTLNRAEAVTEILYDLSLTRGSLA
jgi:methylenetetrahydrofolate reductase (NADPH)